MQVSISVLISGCNTALGYVRNLIKSFKARVSSYPNSIFEAEACLSASLKELNAIGLLDNASLVITPNAYNEGILYDVVPNTTLGDMDVVRATTATRVNSAGLIEVVPKNLASYSEQFDNAIWIKQSSTIVQDFAIAPNGIGNADLCYPTSAGNFRGFRQSSTTSIGLRAKSIFAKQSGKSKFYIRFDNSTYVTFDLANGSIFQNTTGYEATIEDYSNGWYRCNAVNNIETSATSIYIGLSDSSGYPSVTVNGTDGVLFWGAQDEQGSTATSYFPTTDRLNIPRIDYTNGGCPSILVEPQRTNLLLRSEEFGDDYYLKSGTAIVTSNTTISPNGTLTADTVSGATGTSITNVVRRTLTGLTDTHTSSVYVKSLGATTFSINHRNGISDVITRKIVTLTSDWQKVELSSIIENGQVCFGGSDGDFAIWGAQLEQGSNATSYIPTIASTVTRNADVISKTGISSLIGQTEGTVFFDLNTIKFKPDFNSIMFSDGTDGFRFGITSDSNFTQLQCIYVSTQTFSSNVLALPIATKVKIAIKYSIGELKFFANGVLISSFSPANDFSVNNLSQFRTGRPAGGREFFGEISSILLWKTKLTDAECIALTTL